MTKRVLFRRVDGNVAYNERCVEVNDGIVQTIDSPAYVRTGDDSWIARCFCGKWIASKGGHTVAPNGEVSPSFLHEECGFHVWAIFEAWAM